MLASAAIVALVVLITAVGWLVSDRHRTGTYSYSGPLRSIELRLSAARVAIVGSSSSTIEVRRSDDYSFGHVARETRSVDGGVLRISSSCPRVVVGSCSASYELAVPETVAVTVATTSGDIRLTGFRGDAAMRTGSGNIDVAAYCGFNLSGASGSGGIHVAAACAPRSLVLRTRSGDAVALVPPGRYRIGVGSGSGHERVTGVRHDAAAPFTIDVHSGSGSVSVVGGV